MADTTALTEADVTALAGPVAAREFAATSADRRPGLIQWLQETAALNDADFRDAAAYAIYSSAQANAFRGDWTHEHFKASASYHLAQERHQAAGHTPECHGATLYDRAYNQVLREAGHRAEPLARCTCA